MRVSDGAKEGEVAVSQRRGKRRELVEKGGSDSLERRRLLMELTRELNVVLREKLSR